MKRRFVVVAIGIARPRSPTADAQTPPPAPVLSRCDAGAALVRSRSPSMGRGRRPGRADRQHTWQVDVDLRRRHRVGLHERDPATRNIPTRTDDKVSGLPNGTYAWRVKAAQTSAERPSRSFALVGGAGFTVVGLGPAPGRRAASPASPAQFRARVLPDRLDRRARRASLCAGSRRRAVVLVPVDAHDGPAPVRDELPCRVGQRAERLLSRGGRVGGRRARAPVAHAERADHERGAGAAGTKPAVPDRRCVGHVALHARLDRHGRPAGGGLRSRHR